MLSSDQEGFSSVQDQLAVEAPRINMEEPKGKRQKIMLDQRRHLILEPVHKYEGEYSENDDETIKEEPIYEEDEEPSIELSVFKRRINSSLQNQLNSQLEIVRNKVAIVLSQKEKLLTEPEDDNKGLKDENLKLHDELKNTNKKITRLTSFVTVAAEKTSKLSIEHEIKTQQYEQLVEQKDKQLESFKTKISELKAQYNSYLKVFEQKFLQILNVLKQNKVELEQYDLERKTFKNNILGKEEEIQKMANKTEHLKNENCANLLMVSQLNGTVQMLEVENQDFKMKIRDYNQKSIEAQDILESKQQANELIKKLNLQINERKQMLEFIKKLKFECQRLKENNEEELITKDNSHNEALQKFEREAKILSSQILQLQQDNDLLNKKVNVQADNFLKMTNEKEKIKLHVAEQDDRLKQFESSQTENDNLNLEISKLNVKFELKDAESILLNLKVDKLKLQNGELNAQLNRTKMVKYEDIDSQTEPFNELASVNAQAKPADEISMEVEESFKDKDEYPIVGCSSSSVYAAETIGKEIEQGDEKYMEETGDSLEAKTNTAILAPKPTLVTVAIDTNNEQKPWALASGQTDMLQCPVCPYTLQHHHMKGHFRKKHKALSSHRICIGIQGVQSCNQTVSHWAIGKHFNQHIQQRNLLEENERRQQFGLHQRSPPQQPFISPSTPFLAPSPPFLRPQSPWISPWQELASHLQAPQGYPQAPQQQGSFFRSHGWPW